MSVSLDDSVHSSVILELLHQNDRFAQSFDRWSHDKKPDRDVLCILLKDTAHIDCNLVHTLHLLYPGRIQGPFILDHTMSIEILNMDASSDMAYKPRAIESVTGKSHKQARVSFSSDDVAGSSRISEISSTLNESIHRSNHSLCTLGKMTTGRDEAGVWLAFNLVVVGRVHLGFFSTFALSPVFMHVKSMSLRLKPSIQVFLRLYDDGDRRVVKQWQVCPVYTEKGAFACIRSVSTG